MEQSIKQFNSATKNNLVFLLVIITIALTGVVVGGGVYWWENQKKIELNNEIIFLRTQINQLKQVSDITPTGSNNQSDELIEAKFKLDIRDFWDVRQVFRSPQDNNKFYYVTKDGSGASIWVYDLAQDKTYQQNGYFNIPEGNTMLLNQKLAQYQEFRGVGFSGNKFVFVETRSDNSPGPCFSPWFYSSLEYIDLGISKPVRKPFTLPEDLKRKEEQQAKDCQEAL